MIITYYSPTNISLCQATYTQICMKRANKFIYDSIIRLEASSQFNYNIRIHWS
jgi:hypothetical protein